MSKEKEAKEKSSTSMSRWAPPAYAWPELSDGELELIRKRQHSRARIVALLLGAFVILLFFITIAKTGMNW